MDDNFPKLFRCFVCQNYRSVEELEEVVVGDFLFRKQLCKTCLKDIKSGKSGGIDGTPKKEDCKDRNPGGLKVRDSY